MARQFTRVYFIHGDARTVAAVNAEMERMRRAVPGTPPSISAAIRSLIVKGAKATARTTARQSVERRRPATV